MQRQKMISSAFFFYQEANRLDTSQRSDKTGKRKIWGPGNKGSSTEKGKGMYMMMVKGSSRAAAMSQSRLEQGEKGILEKCIYEKTI